MRRRFDPLDILVYIGLTAVAVPLFVFVLPSFYFATRPQNDDDLSALACILATAIAVGGLWLAMTRHLFIHPPPPTGHCPRCGYDCRHTPTRCPECGHPAPLRDPTDDD